MAGLLDPFIPRPVVVKRHEIKVRAPARVVLNTAKQFELESLRSVRLLFWVRGRLLGARKGKPAPHTGFLDQMLGLGWGILADNPNRYVAAGAVCRPWEGDVVFTSIRAEDFERYAEPDRVKIAWTLEVEPLSAAITRLATETRVAATDEAARKKFARYWLAFGAGIVLLRRALLRAVRREAERNWRPGEQSCG